MANGKKKSKALVASSLAPKSIVVSVNGEEVMVPQDKHENAVLNFFLAARMRKVFENHLDMYKQDELKMSPKEIRDLAAAARDIAAFSAEIYAANEPIETGGEKKAQEVETEDIPFDDLSKLPEVKDATGNPPKTDG